MLTGHPPAIVPGSGTAVCHPARLHPGRLLKESVVGANNHRQFLIFVFTLVIGILLFDYLTFACMFSRLLNPNLSLDCLLLPRLFRCSNIARSRFSVLHPHRIIVLYYGLRYFPCLRRILVHGPTLMDYCASRNSILASRASNDHPRSEQPWQVRLHGWTRRSINGRSNGTPTPSLCLR